MVEIDQHRAQHDKPGLEPAARVITIAPDDPCDQKWRQEMAGIVDERLEHLTSQLHPQFVILNVIQDPERLAQCVRAWTLKRVQGDNGRVGSVDVNPPSSP